MKESDLKKMYTKKYYNDLHNVVDNIVFSTHYEYIDTTHHILVFRYGL